MSALFFQSYLTGYLLWLGTALGCWAVTMIAELTGGDWFETLRAPLRAGTRTIPWLVPFFLPVAFGVREIYPWAVDASSLGPHARAYYALPFFYGRAAIYLFAWLVYPWLFARARPPEARRKLAAGGLLVYLFTVSFAWMDWVMSLTPAWKSTVYGLVVVVCQGLSAFAFAIAWTYGRQKLARPESEKTRRDIGNLLLASVILWAYLSFMQYLIIWSGNLPDEVAWYLPRVQAPWRYLIIIISFFQFAIPFAALLFRATKVRTGMMAGIALSLLAVRVLDQLWWVTASYASTGTAITGAIVACIAWGGVWFALAAWQAKEPSHG